jgi:tripartite-type tricarboxylate transporter receptor subunit TctC
MKQRVHQILAGALGALALLASPSQAQVSFKNETVNVYVGYGPGGGYDAYARLLAMHIGRHLPGNPSVVVKNMPGAASMLLTNYLANVAKRDGTEFGMVNSDIAQAPLLGDDTTRKAVQYDPRAISWIGSLDSFVMLAMAWHTSGFKTFEDTKKKEFVWGSSGGGLGPEMYSVLFNEMLGTKWKPLRGYRGSQDIALAMERGELPGFVGWCWECIKADKPHYLTDNSLNLLLQIGIESHPELNKRGVPNALDLIEKPEDKQLYRLAVSSLAYARPFIAPPLPDDRKKLLRDAFAEMTKDPQFLAMADKQKRTITLMRGEAIEKLIAESYTTPPALVERARRAAAEK